MPPGGGRSIVVETRMGTRIDNDVAPEPGPVQLRKYALIRSRHGAWRQRKPPCGGYNCFGQVFASRRTSIRLDGQVALILRDDDYRKLAIDERTMLGDVVLYKMKSTGELLHAAVVAGMMSIVRGSTLLPVLVSKWDDSMGEDEHMLDDVPFDDYFTEIWTDRPRAGAPA